MKSNFNDCLQRLLKSEGGYTNDPSDSGGPTNLGITLKDYQLHIDQNGTAEDVRRLTVDQARTVYKSKYWDALNCDSLSSGVDYSVFDYGVLAGLGRPRKDLKDFKDKSGVALIDAINDERAAFLRALATRRPKDQKFLKGWMNRVDSVRAYSKILARGKDNVSAPVIAGTVTLGAYAAFTQYIHQHPYLSAAAGAAIIGLVWWVVHSIRNKA